jgi:hypothetical protein
MVVENATALDIVISSASSRNLSSEAFEKSAARREFLKE